MILLQKKTFNSFSLVELLVAILIIAIAVSAVLAALAQTHASIARNRTAQSASETADNYLSMIYLSTNITEFVFSDQEKQLLKEQTGFPVVLPVIISNRGPHHQMIIYKTVNRLDPLWLDIGIEILSIEIDNRGTNERRNWMETTFSESYLKRMY